MRAIALLLLLAATTAQAQERELRIVNSLRVAGCPHHLRSDQSFKLNSKLIGAARYVADRMSMRDALKRAGYRADQSADIHVTGFADDSAFRTMLLRNYCATLTDPRLTEIGIARNGREVAMIFATPFSPPAISDAAKVEREVLRLVNEARGKSRRCGGKLLPPAQPLALNATLHVAAVAHAKDMAQHGEVTHDGSDGSSPDQRATRAGYKWSFVGENVAGGQLSAKEVVDGWLTSPHHCENIMDKDFTQMAVAFAINPDRKIGIYWAQEFGRPR